MASRKRKREVDDEIKFAASIGTYTTNEGLLAFRYTGVEVRKIDDVKGYGVFATKHLKPGFWFPYGGVPIDSDLVSSRLSNATKPAQYAAYIAVNEWASESDKVDEAVGWVDAHPNIYLKQHPQQPQFAWIGAYCNQPSGDLDENARLIVNEVGDAVTVPLYPNCSAKCRTFVEITHSVKNGQEILLYYDSKPNPLRYLRSHANYMPTRDARHYEREQKKQVSGRHGAKVVQTVGLRQSARRSTLDKAKAARVRQCMNINIKAANKKAALHKKMAALRDRK